MRQRGRSGSPGTARVKQSGPAAQKPGKPRPTTGGRRTVWWVVWLLVGLVVIESAFYLYKPDGRRGTMPSDTIPSSLASTSPHSPSTSASPPVQSTTHTHSSSQPNVMKAATAAGRRVVVIGGGLAGQSAAIEAARHGAHVLLLEKEARLGGNSAKATSGINGWGTEAQKAQGIEDSAKYFERDTFRSGRGGHCQPGLVQMLSQKSAQAVHWLTTFGIPLSQLSQLGGASRKRCHRAPEKPNGAPMPIGYTTVSTLEKYIRSELADLVTIDTQSRLVKLLSSTQQLPTGDAVTVVGGVEYDQSQTHEDGTVTVTRKSSLADAVILATGGFSNDHTESSLLQEYAPQLAAFPTTNGVWATGDGVKMARELGVQLVDMDKVQLHPTGLLNPKDPRAKTVFLGPESLRGSGGILLNKRGERFINELDLRSVVSQAIMAQDDVFPESDNRKFAHCVLNDAAAKLFGEGTLGFYWKKMGLFAKADTVEELAQLIGCDVSVLSKTLADYHELSTNPSRPCPLTGKNVFPCVLGPQGPFYVAYVTPSIHYTMGGCLISPSAEIQSSKTDQLGMRLPILGLYGAGEVTGGVHGKNRLGGNSLLECVVFGRIAGGRAAEAAPALLSPALSADTWTSVAVEEIVPEKGSDENGTHEGARQVVLGLPSGYQISGLRTLQPLRLRKGHDGQAREVQMVPMTPPTQLGKVAVYLPAEPAPDRHDAWLYSLNAGDVLEVQPGSMNVVSGGVEKAMIDQLEASKYLFVVASAPSGVAPLLQLLRGSAAPPLEGHLKHLHVLYAAHNATGMSYQAMVRACERDTTSCSFLLDEPPATWTEGVGQLDAEALSNFFAAASKLPNGDSSSDITVVVSGTAADAAIVGSYLSKQPHMSECRFIQLVR